MISSTTLLGTGSDGQPVYLKDIWPDTEEIASTVNQTLKPDMFLHAYEESLRGDERWNALDVPGGDIYEWDEASTYVKRPPFFQGMGPRVPQVEDISGARVAGCSGRFGNHGPHLPCRGDTRRQSHGRVI